MLRQFSILLSITFAFHFPAFADEADGGSALDAIYESLLKEEEKDRKALERQTDLRTNNFRHSGTISEQERKGPLRVSVSGMAEFDFLTRDEVLDLRRSRVRPYFKYFHNFYLQAKSRTSQLTLWQRIFGKGTTDERPRKVDYEPSKAVFGQIKSGKPWWGMLGISYYGPGKRGIDGLSEESRFVLNPYLFVGVAEVSARVVNSNSISSHQIYPELRSLEFDLSNKIGIAEYNHKPFFNYLNRNQRRRGEKPDVTLIAMNARDFHMNYIAVDPSITENVVYKSGIVRPVLIKQYIHQGGSCGYPGGCNNMSPHQPLLEMRVTKLPAIIHTLLWNRKPSEQGAEPDMEFRIVLR